MYRKFYISYPAVTAEFSSPSVRQQTSIKTPCLAVPAVARAVT